MRRLIVFDCLGDTLAATLDDAAGPTGLLIVSGGNEVRAGAHRGMALLAARLADQGIPVFRYDRRGVGDSAGTNRGYLDARADLVAAVKAFRTAVPHLTRIMGFGNCDGASTLALFGREAGIDALLLANPWLTTEPDDLPPPAAIRARYAERLRDPRSWLDLMRGKISFARLFKGMKKIAQPAPVDEAPVLRALRGWHDDAGILLAKSDAMALAYADVARRAGLTLHTETIDTASHSFARAGDHEALFAAMLVACR